MEIISVPERGATPITSEELGSLINSKPFQKLMDTGILQVAVKKGNTYLEAGPFVGSVHLNKLERLEVTEKSPNAAINLYRFAFPAAFKFVETSTHYGSLDYGFESTLLAEILRRAFIEAVQNYLSSGIEAAYLQTITSSSKPRGRVLIKETIQQGFARGRPSRVVCRTSELTRATPFNKLLVCALHGIGQTIKNSTSDTKTAARLLLYHFNGVSHGSNDTKQLVMDARYATQKSDVLRPYEDLVELAAAILTDEEFASGVYDSFGLPIATFISLEKLFERGVLETAKSAFSAHARWSVVKGEEDDEERFLFGDTRKLLANPDVVIAHLKKPVLLIDAKYRELGERISHDSVYQLVCHCQAYGVTEAWLVGITDSSQSVCKTLGITSQGVKIRIFASPVCDMSAMLSKELKNLHISSLI